MLLEILLSTAGWSHAQAVVGYTTGAKRLTVDAGCRESEEFLAACVSLDEEQDLYPVTV